MRFVSRVHLPLLPQDDDTEQNRVYTVALGEMFKPGTTSHRYVTQYTALDIVEANWDLPTLGFNDDGNPSFLLDAIKLD